MSNTVMQYLKRIEIKLNVSTTTKSVNIISKKKPNVCFLFK